MSQASVALGSPKKSVDLGHFNVTSNGDEMDVYYNINFGDHRYNMFDMNSDSYKNLRNTHQSFHSSGQGHMKEKRKGKEKSFLLDVFLIEAY